MLFKSRIVATQLATTTQQSIETRGPSFHKGGVRGLAIILGITSHTS